MLYAITSQFIDDCQQKRQQTRPAHLARLTALQDQGRLVLAGPHPAIDSEDPGPAGFSGSLIVVEFDSLQNAQAWADSDPYAGIYAQVTVKPFIQVFPK
ncbi:MAG TPA: YciI family protein [Gammaproteobacteria bacterium]|nr:YciI family protein [Gammaproteobacteria bacterium]